MATEALDVIIAGTAPDEITVAANELIARIQQQYGPYIEEARNMGVTLDPDPVSAGLPAMIQMLATLRNDSNILGGWLLQATTEKRSAQARVKAAKTSYEEKLQMLLSFDEEVAEETGQQAKMALARHKMSREARIVAYADRIYTLVLGYYEALKLLHDQLADTKRDLMAQLAVIKQQIAIGEVHPNVFPADRPGIGPAVTPMAETEAAIAADLGGQEGYVTL